MLKALFALVAAALFSGGALTGLLGQRTASGAAPAFGRPARGLQLVLASLSLVLGAWAWWKTGDQALLVGALLIGAVVPLIFLGKGRSTLVGALLGLAAVAAYLLAFLWP